MAHTQHMIAGYKVSVIQDAVTGDPQSSVLQYIADRLSAGDTNGELIEGRWYAVKETENKVWELKAHSYQIADTGDYDSHYELTNGDISLITRDDLDEADQIGLLVWLNQADVEWEDWKLSDKEFELHLEKEEVKKWKKIARALYEALKDRTDVEGYLRDNEATALNLYEEANK